MNLKFPPTWSEEFELLDGSYYLSDIQDYFEYILKTESQNIESRLKLKQDIISNF